MTLVCSQTQTATFIYFAFKIFFKLILNRLHSCPYTNAYHVQPPAAAYASTRTLRALRDTLYTA